MGPHPHIHRRRHQHPLVGRKQQGRGQIIGQTIGHLRQKIRRRRGDNHQIGRPRQLDMAHLGLIRQIEQMAIDLFAGQRRQRQRRHELLGGLGQHRRHMRPLPTQGSDQLGDLHRGDAAADDQQNPLSRQHPVPLCAALASRIRHEGRPWQWPPQRTSADQTRYCSSASPWAARLFFILPKACTSSWRTRSLDRPSSLPRASSVCGTSPSLRAITM